MYISTFEQKTCSAYQSMRLSSVLAPVIRWQHYDYMSTNIQQPGGPHTMTTFNIPALSS